jgi:hypothetical protein
MEVRVSMSPRIYQDAMLHLGVCAEEVGFFLANWDAEGKSFRVTDWRPVPPSGIALQSDIHVRLSEAAQAEAIKWAWDQDACLIEAHAHGEHGGACFSPSDLYGFSEWVPHLWWRLGRRPYAAIVTAGEDFDGLAWIESPREATQVVAVELDRHTPVFATQETLTEAGHRRRKSRR